jgi:sterol desaturase/sphingolipid hydroxylase (fatty acid hydroxylase superfamily)
MQPQSYKLLFFLSLLVLMFTFEHFIPIRTWTKKRIFRLIFHLKISVINSLILRIFAIQSLFYLLNLWNLNHWGLSKYLGLYGYKEIILSILIYDFVDYWWHRWNHQVGFLWRFHQSHHSDNHVDVTTALRFHPVELLISCVYKALWIIIWGPSVWGFIAAEIAITSFSQFHHSNINFFPKAEKWIRKIIITPFIHASHHSLSKRIRNQNYSTIFSIWDRLFGTYYPPQESDTKQIGIEQLEDENKIYSISYLYANPLKK